MLRSLFLIAVYCGFLGLGAVAPFVLSLGYVWVDTSGRSRWPNHAPDLG